MQGNPCLLIDTTNTNFVCIHLCCYIIYARIQCYCTSHGCGSCALSFLSWYCKKGCGSKGLLHVFGCNTKKRGTVQRFIIVSCPQLHTGTVRVNRWAKNISSGVLQGVHDDVMIEVV